MPEIDREPQDSRILLEERNRMGFNPPASSHKGGVRERMIRTVRQVLKTTLNQQLVSDEVLSTFMVEAVYMINSRPLTRNSDDHSDDIY